METVRWRALAVCSLLAFILVLIFGGVLWTRPGSPSDWAELLTIPRIQGAGSNDAPMSQQDYEAKQAVATELLNDAITRRKSKDALHQGLIWSSLAIGLLLSLVVTLTGIKVPGSDGNVNDDPPRRKWAWVVVVIVAWMGTVAQGFDKVIDAQRLQLVQSSLKFYKEVSDARLAFEKGKTEPERQIAVRMLTEAIERYRLEN